MEPVGFLFTWSLVASLIPETKMCWLYSTCTWIRRHNIFQKHCELWHSASESIVALKFDGKTSRRILNMFQSDEAYSKACFYDRPSATVLVSMVGVSMINDIFFMQADNMSIYRRAMHLNYRRLIQYLLSSKCLLPGLFKVFMCRQLDYNWISPFPARWPCLQNQLQNRLLSAYLYL